MSDDVGQLGFGEVFFHARIDGAMWSCVSMWRVLEWRSSAARCLVEEMPKLYPTRRIFEPCIAFNANVGQVSHVIFPFKLQARFRSAAP